MHLASCNNENQPIQTEISDESSEN